MSRGFAVEVGRDVAGVGEGGGPVGGDAEGEGGGLGVAAAEEALVEGLQDVERVGVVLCGSGGWLRRGGLRACRPGGPCR